MSSSISSSKAKASAKTLALALLLAAAALAAVEMYWRKAGADASVNPSSDRSLWAFQREHLRGDPQGLAIVGTSRALFGFDLAILARETGHDNVRQLAIAATHPLAALEELASDPDFEGSILCELTAESLAIGRWDSQRPYLDRRAEHFSVPARWGSFIRANVEERIVLLNPALSTLNRVKWKHFGMTDVRTQWSAERSAACVPGHEMPMDWTLAAADAALASARMDLLDSFDRQLRQLDELINRLNARGIPVVFIRAPVAQEVEALYEHYLPRAKYWDRMEAQIAAPFIRADDFPALSSFHLPDGSHLCGADQQAFTHALADVLRARGLLVRDEQRLSPRTRPKRAPSKRTSS